MDHSKENFTEAIGVSENFIKFVVYSVASYALENPIHNTRSGYVEAISYGMNKFWGENERIYNAMNRTERLIIEIGALENITDLIDKSIILKSEHIQNIRAYLLKDAKECKKLYDLE